MESVNLYLCDRKLIYILLVISFHCQLYFTYIGFLLIRFPSPPPPPPINLGSLAPEGKNLFVFVPLHFVYSFIIMKKSNGHIRM